MPAMPLPNLLHSYTSTEHLAHGPPSALPKVGAMTSAAAISTTIASEAHSAFLGGKPLADITPQTSFKEIMLKFIPRDPVPETTEMECEDDLAICNRQCEKLYSDQEAEMEEPCKLAVAAEFGNRGMCFPGTSIVSERRRGAIRMADVNIGDEIVDANDTYTRVIALLHNDALLAEVYLQIQYKTTNEVEGSLSISPAHLVRVRRKSAQSSTMKSSDKASFANIVFADSQWTWIAAQDVRNGDELQNQGGGLVTVLDVSRTCLVGAFAPLTTSGHLIVDGITCSCFAPPWSLSHEACNASMLPVRLLDSARQAVEYVSSFRGSKAPMFTVEAVWLLPTLSDTSLHPWASGLLRTAMMAESGMACCKNLASSVPAAFQLRCSALQLKDSENPPL